MPDRSRSYLPNFVILIYLFTGHNLKKNESWRHPLPCVDIRGTGVGTKERRVREGREGSDLGRRRQEVVIPTDPNQVEIGSRLIRGLLPLDNE